MSGIHNISERLKRKFVPDYEEVESDEEEPEVIARRVLKTDAYEHNEALVGHPGEELRVRKGEKCVSNAWDRVKDAFRTLWFYERKFLCANDSLFDVAGARCQPVINLRVTQSKEWRSGTFHGVGSIIQLVGRQVEVKCVFHTIGNTNCRGDTQDVSDMLALLLIDQRGARAGRA